MNLNLGAVGYALLGGVLPALVWLLFWLREDKKHPEPKNLILKTFLLGMLSVALVLPFQKGVENLFPGITFTTLFLWALLEEVFKFGAGYFGGLHTNEDNEPIDPIIYLITASLGFVALENTLFILGPLLGNNAVETVITGNLRFIGASLLHVASSGFVGVAIAFSFYSSRTKKWFAVILGLLFAVIFHFAFNALILHLGSYGTTVAFVGVWITIALLLLTFERVKSIAR